MIIKESVIISKKNKKEFEFGYSLLRALILKIGGKSEPFRSSLNKKKTEQFGQSTPCRGKPAELQQCYQNRSRVTN